MVYCIVHVRPKLTISGGGVKLELLFGDKLMVEVYRTIHVRSKTITTVARFTFSLFFAYKTTRRTSKVQGPST